MKIISIAAYNNSQNYKKTTQLKQPHKFSYNKMPSNSLENMNFNFLSFRQKEFKNDEEKDSDEYDDKFENDEDDDVPFGFQSMDDEDDF